MTQGSTRFLTEKLTILDHCVLLIRNAEFAPMPDDPSTAAHEALRRLNQLRQLLLGTRDKSSQQKLVDTLIEARIDPDREVSDGR